MNKKYAGIGSRATTPEICETFTKVAGFLEKKGYTLRSGAAPGADEAFEKGVIKLKEIYLPWRGFNGNNSQLFKLTPAAFDFTSKYHPAWDKLSSAGRKLMARNSFIILGQDIKDPVDFVVCWTPDGKDVGGTSHALRIARDFGIKVFNFAIESEKASLRDFLKSL